MGNSNASYSVCAAALWAVLGQWAFGGDWPQFLGPSRDGAVAETGLAEELDGKRVTAWRRPVGLGVAGPVVAGGSLYLFQLEGGEETLSAFDPATGAERWRLGYPCDYEGGMFRERGPRATPAVAAEGIVTFGSAGVLQLVGRDGKLRWRRDLHREYNVPDGYFGASCSPALHGGLALLNLGGAPNAGLAAFRLADGKTAWTATADTASYSSPVVADIAGRPTALFFARTGLHGVDPATGAGRFFHRFRSRMDASVNAATPLVRGNEVFLSSSYGVGSTVVDCGGAAPQLKWRQEDVLACHFNTPVRIGDDLYGIDGRHEGRPSLQCVAWATGAVRWTEANFGCATALAAGKFLWLMREDGELALVEAAPAGFRPRGRQKLFDQGPVRAHPALADGTLYVRGPKELLALPLRK